MIAYEVQRKLMIHIGNIDTSEKHWWRFLEENLASFEMEENEGMMVEDRLDWHDRVQEGSRGFMRK